MKIIKRGTPPKPKLPRWHGKRLTCPACKSVVELEGGKDWPLVSEYNIANTSCPVCMSVLYFSFQGDFPQIFK